MADHYTAKDLKRIKEDIEYDIDEILEDYLRTIKKKVSEWMAGERLPQPPYLLRHLVSQKMLLEDLMKNLEDNNAS